MTTTGKTILTQVIPEKVELRPIEPHIYSVVSGAAASNAYDTRFGNIYDWVACNPFYNRFVWGYSIAAFSSFVHEALAASRSGIVLDLGCGSLAFTARVYAQDRGRPVVLVDQSLKMLRIAKSRLIALNGKVPDNMIFLHADALNMPFLPNNFETVVCLNLLHCLPDLKVVMRGLNRVLVDKGRIYFSTLIQGNRLADRYLKALGNAGKLVPRNVEQLHSLFEFNSLFRKTTDMRGNMAFIVVEKALPQSDENRG